MTYVKPNDVRSPRAHWSLIEVLLDRGERDCAYALGIWDGERRIGFRWNGHADNPLGNPQSRGLPTWTMLDPHLHESIVDQLPFDKRSVARAYLGIKLMFEGPQLNSENHEIVLYDFVQNPPVIAIVACDLVRELVQRPEISDSDCQLLVARHKSLLSAVATVKFESGGFSVNQNARLKVIRLERDQLLSIANQVSTDVLSIAALSHWGA